jgi:hypothetical protein
MPLTTMRAMMPKKVKNSYRCQWKHSVLVFQIYHSSCFGWVYLPENAADKYCVCALQQVWDCSIDLLMHYLLSFLSTGLHQASSIL